MSKLTEEDLDAIELKYITALKTDDDTPASKLELMRKTLLDNGRLVVTPTPGNATSLETDMDEDDAEIPFPIHSIK
jgi:hypothetical protein